MQVHHNEGSVRVRVVLLLVCVQRSEVGGKFIYHSKLPRCRKQILEVTLIFLPCIRMSEREHKQTTYTAEIMKRATLLRDWVMQPPLLRIHNASTSSKRPASIFHHDFISINHQLSIKNLSIYPSMLSVNVHHDKLIMSVDCSESMIPLNDA